MVDHTMTHPTKRVDTRCHSVPRLAAALPDSQPQLQFGASRRWPGHLFPTTSKLRPCRAAAFRLISCLLACLLACLPACLTGSQIHTHIYTHIYTSTNTNTNTDARTSQQHHPPPPPPRPRRPPPPPPPQSSRTPREAAGEHRCNAAPSSRLPASLSI